MENAMRSATNDAHEFLKRELASLGKMTSALVLASDVYKALDTKDASSRVREALRRASPDSPAKDTVFLDQDGVRETKERMLPWLLDAMIIRLDCLAHAVADKALDRREDDELSSIEDDYSKVYRWQREDDTKENAANVASAYKQLIRLSVIRNGIVHANGCPPSEQRKRLARAEWTEEEQTSALAELTLDDVYKFRSAVRTMGSRLIQMVEELGISGYLQF